MSPRGFVILLIVTLVALVGAIVAAVQPTMSGTDSVAGAPMFPALGQSVPDASTVRVQTPQYTASWKWQDGVWVSPERGDYPARKGLVPELVSGLARMTKVEAKTSKPEWYQHIRVGDPAATPPTGVAHLTVTSANGEVFADAILGARSFSIAASHARGGTFVRKADEAQSWLVEGTASVPAELPDWFDALVDIPGPEIASVAVLVGDRTVFEARKADAAAGTYEVVSLDPAEGEGENVANDNTIRSLASAIVGMRMDDARAIDSVVPGENARTNRFTTTAGLQLDVTVFDVDGATWAIFKASAPEGSEAAAAAADINGRTGKWAFRLNASRATRLTQPVANLVQKPADPALGGVTPIPLNENGMPMFLPDSMTPGLPGGVTLPTF